MVYSSREVRKRVSVTRWVGLWACVALLAVIVLAGAAHGAEAESIYAVYDPNWNLRYFLKDTVLYGLDWQVQYYLRGDSVFDKGWIKRYYVKGDALYDWDWQLRYYIRYYGDAEKP